MKTVYKTSPIRRILTGFASLCLMAFHGLLADAQTPGTIQTVAGNGVAGYGEDGHPATDASIALGFGLSVDEQGNIYFADATNYRIRRIDSGGLISTVAGNGTFGYSGDGGPATAARLDTPFDVVCSPDGGLYIADTYNHRIRRITPDGRIHTVAGSGSAGYSGDGRPATEARLNTPFGVAVDKYGGLYIADTYNHRIRRITPDGRIHTVAGAGSAGYSGDGGPATAAQLNTPFGVAVDSVGILYITDTYNHRIRRVTPDGIIRAVAGNGKEGFTGDHIPATQTSLFSPHRIALSSRGSIYFTDAENHRVRCIDPEGIIVTVAGGARKGYGGDGGPAIRALLNTPTGIGVNRNGDLFITDTRNYRVRKVSGFMRTLTVNVIPTSFRTSIHVLSDDVQDIEEDVVPLRRQFPFGTRLTIEAPETTGRLAFYGWKKDGRLISRDRTLTLRVEEDLRIEAEFNTPPDTLAPETPTGFSGVAYTDRIVLQWLPVQAPDIASYHIWRGLSPDRETGSEIAALTADRSVWTDREVSPGKTYYYRISAGDSAGNISDPGVFLNLTVPFPLDTLPPEPPLRLTAYPVDGQVFLQWERSPSSDLANYALFRDHTGDMPGVEPYRILSSSTLTFVDTGVPVGQIWYYRVSAVDSAGNRSVNNPSVQAVMRPMLDRIPPQPPGGLRARAVERVIRLEWRKNQETDLAVYRLQRSVNSVIALDTSAILIALPAHQTTWNDSAIMQGITYYYRLTATDTEGNVSVPGDPVSVYVPLPPDTLAPSAPTGLSASAQTHRIRLSWAAGAESDLAGYLLSRGSYPDTLYAYACISASVTVFEDTVITPGVTYFYGVAAFDTAGNVGPYSAALAATAPEPPDITAPDIRLLSNMSYTDPGSPFEVVARITDDRNALAAFLVHYHDRQPVSLDTLVMAHRSDTTFYARIASAAMKPPGISLFIVAEDTSGNVSMSPVVFIPIEAPSTPFALFQNTPNPFNPTTTISFALPEPAHVTLSIYNLLGQEVIRLMDEYRPAGRYSVFWNGENTSGQPVASGLYLYRLQTDKAGITRKMSLLR